MPSDETKRLLREADVLVRELEGDGKTTDELDKEIETSVRKLYELGGITVHERVK